MTNCRDCYYEFVVLGRYVIDFILEGRSDAPEAEGIRDTMDTLWLEMTDVERKLARRTLEKALAQAQGEDFSLF